MVKFDIASVSADGKKLLIGATVLDIPYYKNIVIEKVYIDTQDTYESLRPSSKAWEHTCVADDFKSINILDCDCDIPATMSSSVLEQFLNGSSSSSTAEETGDTGETTEDTTEDTTTEETEEEEIDVTKRKSIFLELSLNDFDDNNNPLPDPRKNLFFIYVKCSTDFTCDIPCALQPAFNMTYAYDTSVIRESLMFYVKEITNTCEIPKKFIDLYLKSKALEISLCQSHYPEAIKFFNAFYKNPRLWRDRPDKDDNAMIGFGLVDAYKCGCNG